MDHNATLADIRRLIGAIEDRKTEIVTAGDEDSKETEALRDLNSIDALDVVERVEALDGWMSRGGLLPSAWEREKPAIESALLSWWSDLDDDERELTGVEY